MPRPDQEARSRWSEVSRLFDEALERPVGDRRTWLEDAASDPSVREEVVSLLDAHARLHALDRFRHVVILVHWYIFVNPSAWAASFWSTEA